MINELVKYLKDKKILILGFGKEGKSSYYFIRKYLKEKKLYIADLNEKLKEQNSFLNDDKNIELICGKNYLDNLENYDLIIKTPGVSLKDKDVSKYREKITSQLELLLEFFKNKVIGITGTKGKSTTSSIIYQILKDQKKDVMLLGNIGTPVFEHLEQINENTILVLEISSHQLEYMDKSPNISILTNLFPEHLDHYNSYECYAMAKFNIFKYQKQGDFFLYDYDNENLNEFEIFKNLNNGKSDLKQNIIKVSTDEKKGQANIQLRDGAVYYDNKEIYNVNDKRNLLGIYNLKNIMFALGVSQILNLDLNTTKKTISEFKTLPHRLEFVEEVDGVKYYDNSIATIPEAVIEAVSALGDVSTLIIGGMDRGVDLSDFTEYLKNSDIPHIICMPTTGHIIAKQANSDKFIDNNTFEKQMISDKAKVDDTFENRKVSERFIVVDTLEEAVDIAKKVTEKGKSCLLAPAAASYEFFKNFEEKGDCFKKLVLSD